MRGSGMSARAGARRSRKAPRTTLRLALLTVVAAVVAAIIVPALASAESGAADTARPPHTDTSARSDAPDGPDAATKARVATYVAGVQAARQRDAVIAYVAAKQRAAIAAYVNAVQRAAQQHHASASHRATRTSGSTTVSSSGGGGFLACVRQRESHGNYAAVNGRSGTAGAYQFMPSTWNNTARSAGRPDLVGVNPAAASPASQDAMAQALYTTQGRAPWSGNGC